MSAKAAARFLEREYFWVRRPKRFTITENEVEIVTEPHTDLWQRTYYGFCRDSAPLLLSETEELFFSFTVRARFSPACRFDQCGIAVYIDENNWLKASAEYENDTVQRLGSVVTNGGYSDWATTDIPASVREIWYRLSRRGSDFLLEYSFDGERFCQMRICRLREGAGKISFGVYACSPENSSFAARFSEMRVGACLWEEHK